MIKRLKSIWQKANAVAGSVRIEQMASDIEFVLKHMSNDSLEVTESSKSVKSYRDAVQMSKKVTSFYNKYEIRRIADNLRRSGIKQ